MSTESNINQKQREKMCSNPELRQLLPDYIFDDLSDADAFKVELHLADCFSCKEHYHTVLRASAEMQVLAHTPSQKPTPPAPKGQYLARQKDKYAKKAGGSV